MLKWTIIAALGFAAPAMAGPLNAVNAARSAEGLPALTENAALMAAAQAQADHMAQLGAMTHEGPEGESIMPRVREAGYTACFAAENVAVGQSSGDAVVGAWMDSKGHRRNILAENATDGAIARAVAPSGQPYWAMAVAAGC